MIDRGHDKAGVGQRFCRVMVPAEPASAAVRDDHQRQFAPRDRTVLYALKGIGPVHRKAAERYALRRRRPGIPDGACQIWIGIEKLDAGRRRRRTQTTKYYGANPTRIAYQGSPQFDKWN